MASSPPPFLLAKVRFAFRQCAQHHKVTSCRPLSSSQWTSFHTYLPQNASRARSTQQPVQPLVEESVKHESKQDNSLRSERNKNPSIAPASHTNAPQSNESKELVPQERDGRAVGRGRTVDAPMKIIPKADITPNLRLTPRERLHIEILTRRPPPVIKQVKPYKERLLIYHHGNAAENALVFLKVLGLICAGAVTLVIVPAHYTAGTPLWACGALLLAGWFPSFFFHHLLKPLVTRIHLRLPPNARVSPSAAMKYAKNLPASAQLDMSFTRITALPGAVTVNVADLQPIPQSSRRPWQFANVRWIGNQVDRGTKFRPNPIEFSVKSAVPAGRAKRDVIPGIWPEVYARLIGEVKESTSRWKKI